MARTHLSSIMTRAHELAREMEGDYSARLVLGLRQAWAEHNAGGKSVTERLVEAGGSEWQKHGHHRIYFNGLTKWYGLETEHYGTGNVSSATLDGERISNSGARTILGDLSYAKIWYDVNTGKFHGKGYDIDRYFDTIVDRIKATACITTGQEAA